MVVAGGGAGAEGADGAAAGCGGFGIADGVLGSSGLQEDGNSRNAAMGRKCERQDKTHGIAAEPPAAGLAGHAKGVAAAGGSRRRAKGSQGRGGRHAALV